MCVCVCIYIEHSFKVCLFGGEIRWMKKFWRENGKENYFEVYLVGWRGRKINNGGLDVFSLGLPKSVRTNL